jgi:hypothetical protein
MGETTKLERLIDRHGDCNFLDFTFKLTFPPNPNGLYLIKGGGPDVQRKFGVPRCWRKPQGLIHGNAPCLVEGQHLGYVGFGFRLSRGLIGSRFAGSSNASKATRVGHCTKS